MGLDPVKGLSLMFILLYYVTLIQGEIRCYCNEARCVTSGYMCKSQLGMCYSLVQSKDESMDPSHNAVVHGCADTLDREPRMRTCAGQGAAINDADKLNVTETKTVTVTNTVELTDTKEEIVDDIIETQETLSNNVDPSEPILTCCTQDMCNYFSIILEPEFDENKKDGLGNKDGISSKRTDEVDKPQKDLWFKAAVIAVPIAGGFILILLVLLAVRMLRSDSRQHRRLIQIRRERSLTKAQLYVTDHFIDKENKIYKPCDNNCSHTHQTCVHSHTSKRDSQNSQNNQTHSQNNSNSHCPHHKHSPSQKVTINKDGHTYEQIISPSSDGGSSSCCENSTNSSNSSNNNRTSPYPSVIVWGQPKTCDVAEVV